jgi:hypothetical protein
MSVGVWPELTFYHCKSKNMPGSIISTTLLGKDLKKANMNGKCFKKCPADSTAYIVSSQKGEKSGVSRRFQLRLSAYKVTMSNRETHVHLTH